MTIFFSGSIVVGLTGVPHQETDASASGNGRSARGPYAPSVYNFSKRLASRFLSLSFLTSSKTTRNLYGRRPSVRVPSRPPPATLRSKRVSFSLYKRVL